MPDLGGVYSTLSGYAHPSLQFLDELLIDSIHSDGFRRATWRVDRSLAHWQCKAAGVLLYRSATLMVSYLDGPQDELEAAMDDFEAGLGDAPT